MPGEKEQVRTGEATHHAALFPLVISFQLPNRSCTHGLCNEMHIWLKRLGRSFGDALASVLELRPRG